jgi:hypothetical protein
MKELRIKFTGVTPLLMHNSQLANPLNAWAKEIKKVSGKRKKTDADHEEMSRLEWFGGLYLDEKSRLIVPSEMVEAAMKVAAKREKKGKAVDRGLVCRSTSPLDIGKTYKDVDELRPTHILIAAVNIKQNKIMRTRPKFDTWSFIASIQYDEYVLEETDIITFAKNATFGDWRPRFGQVKAEKI